MIENQNNMFDVTHDLQTSVLSQTVTLSQIPSLPWSA